MDIHEAKKLIDQEEVTIVDIRDQASYHEVHIPKAIHFTDANVEQFLKETAREKTLLCYCYHGYSSQNAAAFFKEQGFKTVYSMDGGFEAWRAVYPTVQ